MLIIGPTNNGKTMIVEKFRHRHLPYESEDRSHEIIPVLMVQMPSDPTIKRFYSAIIAALGSPIKIYPSTIQSEQMALRCLVPYCDGVYYQQLPSKEELWGKYYTAAPERQRQFVEHSKIVKRA